MTTMAPKRHQKPSAHGRRTEKAIRRRRQKPNHQSPTAKKVIAKSARRKQSDLHQLMGKLGKEVARSAERQAKPQELALKALRMARPRPRDKRSPITQTNPGLQDSSMYLQQRLNGDGRQPSNFSLERASTRQHYPLSSSTFLLTKHLTCSPPH